MGEIGQNFSVEGDIFFGQRFNKSAVGHALLANGRIDLDIPEAPKIPFLFAAIEIGVLEGLADRVFGHFVAVLAVPFIALSHLQNLSFLFVGANGAFSSCHKIIRVITPLIRACRSTLKSIDPERESSQSRMAQPPLILRGGTVRNFLFIIFPSLFQKLLTYWVALRRHASFFWPNRPIVWR